MEHPVYQKPIQDIDDLKQRLIAAWSGITSRLSTRRLTSGTSGYELV